MRNVFKVAQSNDVFSAEVPLEVYAQNSSIDSLTQEVKVSYAIEVDYRSYGIKEINVAPQGVFEAVVAVLGDDGEPTQQFSIQVDCTQLKQERQPANGSLWAESVTVWLDQNNQVDYKRSTIDFHG